MYFEMSIVMCYKRTLCVLRNATDIRQIAKDSLQTTWMITDCYSVALLSLVKLNVILVLMLKLICSQVVMEDRFNYIFFAFFCKKNIFSVFCVCLCFVAIR